MQFLYGLYDCEFLNYRQLIKVIPETTKETLSTKGIRREPIDLLLLNVKKTKYVTKLNQNGENMLVKQILWTGRIFTLYH